MEQLGGSSNGDTPRAGWCGKILSTYGWELGVSLFQETKNPCLPGFNLIWRWNVRISLARRFVYISMKCLHQQIWIKLAGDAESTGRYPNGVSHCGNGVPMFKIKQGNPQETVYLWKNHWFGYFPLFGQPYCRSLWPWTPKKIERKCFEWSPPWHSIHPIWHSVWQIF